MMCKAYHKQASPASEASLRWKNVKLFSKNVKFSLASGGAFFYNYIQNGVRFGRKYEIDKENEP